MIAQVNPVGNQSMSQSIPIVLLCRDLPWVGDEGGNDQQGNAQESLKYIVLYSNTGPKIDCAIYRKIPDKLSMAWRHTVAFAEMG